jgi:hypothetical protein
MAAGGGRERERPVGESTEGGLKESKSPQGAKRCTLQE